MGQRFKPYRYLLPPPPIKRPEQERGPEEVGHLQHLNCLPPLGWVGRRHDVSVDCPEPHHQGDQTNHLE